jgi:hypothetical protein
MRHHQTTRRTLLFALSVGLAVLACTAGTAWSQSTPDLAGSWALDVARSDPGAAAQNRGRGGPAPMVITQSATEITVQRGNQTFIYKLDGSEMPGPPGGETKGRMRWENGALVVTWTREFYAGKELGYQTSTGRDVYTLSGSTLTVERSATNARGKGGTETVKSVYTKS